MKKSILLLTFFLFAIVQKNISQPVITFAPVITSGLSSPVDVVSANDGTNRIFIVQQGGTIKVYDNNYTLLNVDFLTINTNISTGGERGLLSLVFHPDFENNRYFFVYYTNSAGGVNIDRFQTLAGNSNQGDIATRTNIMTIPKPVVFSNHNGGKLNFGADGNLYAGLGDSGSGGDPGNLAQNGNSLWGKILRINVDNFATPPYYTIPLDNPFIADPAVLDEIFSLGLRNPWRWSFDRVTGNTWIADVGQGLREEVNMLTQVQASGGNYGWRCYEGTLPYNTTGCLPAGSYVAPVFEYPHNFATGGFSITGGYVYRGSLYPALVGYYICADYVSGNGFIINATTLSANLQIGFPGNITGFGERENGELLALSIGGTLYTVGTSTVLPIRILEWSGVAANGYNQLNWQTTNEDKLKQYDVEYSTDGIQFTLAGTMLAKNISPSFYTFNHPIQTTASLYYRLKIIKNDGSFTYSDTIVIKHNTTLNKSIIRYKSTNPTSIWLNVPPNEKVSFQLLSMSGQNIITINDYPLNSTINLNKLSTGLYIGKIQIGETIITEKVWIR